MQAQPFTIYLPDTRGVEISRYGRGNGKIGPDVYTYSRLPGRPYRPALGSIGGEPVTDDVPSLFAIARRAGTCPGSTPKCESVCYAARVVTEDGPVADIWYENSWQEDVPPIPEDCKLLRIHVGGDFDSTQYILNWVERLTHRLDVLAWAYTRSWRVSKLLPALEQLRALPSMTLFASMDASHSDLPPSGWRRAWIDGDPRAGSPQLVRAHMEAPELHNIKTFDGTMTYVCPEETKRVKDCQSCGYCLAGEHNDVTFLLH